MDEKMVVFLVCMAISNNDSLCSSESEVNQKAIGGIYFTKKWRAETPQPGLEFDNFKPRLKSGIFNCISWLNGSSFAGDDRGFLEELFKTNLIVPMSPLNWPILCRFQFSFHVYILWMCVTWFGKFFFGLGKQYKIETFLWKKKEGVVKPLHELESILGSHVNRETSRTGCNYQKRACLVAGRVVQVLTTQHRGRKSATRCRESIRKNSDEIVADFRMNKKELVSYIEGNRISPGFFDF